MMTKLLFNEASAIKNLIDLKVVDPNNIFNTIKDVARYNFFVDNIDGEENYNRVLDYITKNAKDVFQENIYDIVDKCVRGAKKYPLKSVDFVPITESELQFITSLENIKEEKAAFVMLAIAKYYNIIKGEDYDSVFINHADICKMARITIPADKRSVFMQFAYDKGVLHRHTYADSIIKKLTFVSHDDNDKVVLKLTEGDFKDLAYTYMAYLTPHKYRRCVGCNCWIKKDSKDRRLCKECADTTDTEKSSVKEVQCVDCGRSIYVSVLNTKTCRCEECQSVVDKELRAARNARYYSSHKN